MNKATFYTLSKEQDKFPFISKLSRKLWRQSKTHGLPIWILCDNKETANGISNTLWESDQDSFLANEIIQHYLEYQPKKNTIIISSAMPVPDWVGIIINLTQYTITQLQKNNIIEVIGHSVQEKNIGRTRFKQYKKAGFATAHYQIK